MFSVLLRYAIWHTYLLLYIQYPILYAFFAVYQGDKFGEITPAELRSHARIKCAMHPEESWNKNGYLSPANASARQTFATICAVVLRFLANSNAYRFVLL